MVVVVIVMVMVVLVLNNCELLLHTPLHIFLFFRNHGCQSNLDGPALKAPLEE